MTTNTEITKAQHAALYKAGREVFAEGEAVNGYYAGMAIDDECGAVGINGAGAYAQAAEAFRLGYADAKAERFSQR